MRSSDLSSRNIEIVNSSATTEQLFSRVQIILLVGIIWAVPLVDTWTRPVGPLKLVEILAAALVASVALTNKRVPLNLTPAGRSLLMFLFLSVASFLMFYLVDFPATVATSVTWASGLRTPPLYNAFKIGQQMLFICLFILIANIRRLRVVLLLLRSYVLAATAASLFGIGQFVAYYLVGSDFGISMWFLPRVASTFPEPGPFSSYLLTSIFILVVLLLKRNELLFQTHAVAILLGIQLLAELLTFSGRGLVGFIIVLILLLVTDLNMKQRLAVLGSGILSLLGLLSIDRVAKPLVYTFTTKIQIYLTANRFAAASGGRVAGLYIAPQMFLKNPLLGVGTGNYPVLRNHLKPDWVPKVSFLDLPANHYLQILAENGILGFAAFMFGMGMLLQSLWNGRFTVNTELRPVLTGTIFASISMFVILIVSSALWFAHVWVPLGLAYATMQSGLSNNSLHSRA